MNTPTTKYLITDIKHPVTSFFRLCHLYLFTIICLFAARSKGFTSPPLLTNTGHQISYQSKPATQLKYLNSDGTENKSPTSEVVVNIERTSSNSRRIGGELIVNAPIGDVWAILTDYDNLANHVPNLIESRVVDGPPGQRSRGRGGPTCRLYQRGAQKIIGFQFGADVTMDMTERITSRSQGSISFKCVDSFFFSGFDGEWRVTSNPDGTTKMNYIVDVRPKGPVPVAALEWRIREDVPTNMKAVKDAAVKRSERSQQRAMSSGRTTDARILTGVNAAKMAVKAGGERVKDLVGLVEDVGQKKFNWGDDETLAAYLPIS